MNGYNVHWGWKKVAVSSGMFVAGQQWAPVDLMVSPPFPPLQSCNSCRQVGDCSKFKCGRTEWWILGVFFFSQLQWTNDIQDPSWVFDSHSRHVASLPVWWAPGRQWGRDAPPRRASLRPVVFEIGPSRKMGWNKLFVFLVPIEVCSFILEFLALMPFSSLRKYLLE